MRNSSDRPLRRSAPADDHAWGPLGVVPQTTPTRMTVIATGPLGGPESAYAEGSYTSDADVMVEMLRR